MSVCLPVCLSVLSVLFCLFVCLSVCLLYTCIYFVICFLMPCLLLYVCCRGRAVINVVRTCSPTPLLKSGNKICLNYASFLTQSWLITMLPSLIARRWVGRHGSRHKAIHFNWLGSGLLVCCLAHRGPTGVFLLLRS